MNHRKVTFTKFENLMELNKCPVTFTLSKTGGRWKALIIYNLVSGKKRFNEIKKGIPNASEKMIIEKLKELESDGLISRKAYPVVPPHVEYALTQKGETLAPILQSISTWGFAQMVD